MIMGKGEERYGSTGYAAKAGDSAGKKKVMTELYGEAGAEENTERYRHVAQGFKETYGDKDILLFSSPGRTEISGNHTDHNHGKVLAGSINLDCVGAAAKNGTDTIRILSETFNQKFIISLKDLNPSPQMAGTIDLTKGLLKGFQERGYEVGGFDAFITSNVISAAGVSSSAAYEMLICSMVNTLFNGGVIDVVTYAHIGKYAENKFWNKASGLLDQMACAVGGLITIDFKNSGKAGGGAGEFRFRRSESQSGDRKYRKGSCGFKRRLFLRSDRDEKGCRVLRQGGLR